MYSSLSSEILGKAVQGPDAARHIASVLHEREPSPRGSPFLQSNKASSFVRRARKSSSFDTKSELKCPFSWELLVMPTSSYLEILKLRSCAAPIMEGRGIPYSLSPGYPKKIPGVIHLTTIFGNYHTTLKLCIRPSY